MKSIFFNLCMSVLFVKKKKLPKNQLSDQSRQVKSAIFTSEMQEKSLKIEILFQSKVSIPPNCAQYL